MKNWEYYEDELMEFLEKHNFGNVAIKNGKFECCSDISCDECEIRNKGFCSRALIKHLYEEHIEKVKITRLEYELLKYFLHDKEYKFVARDKCGALYWYKDKPIKESTEWINKAIGDSYILSLINNLFQFIKWEDEEPTNIKKILNNCEVIEDE